MKKIYTLFLLGISLISFAQNYKAVYELKFKPNRTKDSTVTDHYVLDIFPKLNKTGFYNYNYYKNDSIMNILGEQSNRTGGVNIDMNALPKVKYPMVYYKEKGGAVLYKSIDGDTYKYPDTEKPVWNIVKESKKIKNWNCQKAETNFLGRKWTAWFTTDLLFPEGPYKFLGLPGLIVEVTDDKTNYAFTLEAFYKSTGESYLPSSYTNAIPVNKSRYDKAWDNYVKDPASKLREGTIVDESGNIFQIHGGFSKDFISKTTAERLKKINDFNNPIEQAN